MSTIPAWINFVAGMTCVGLAVNFFAMAYAPKTLKSVPLYTNQLTDSLPDELRGLRGNIPFEPKNP